MVIVARTYSGGRDLYFGVPNLKNAKIIDIDYKKEYEDYTSTLLIEDEIGNVYKLVIAQEIEK